MHTLIKHGFSGNDERHQQFHSGLVLSEVLAQRKEHEEIARHFKELKDRREEALIQRQYDMDRELTEEQAKRDRRRKEYFKNIETFQRIQIDQKRKELKEAKQSSDSSR